MITELSSLISSLGLPVVLAAVVLYILVHSEFRFTYPRPGKKETSSSRRLRGSAGEDGSSPRVFNPKR